MNKDVNVFDAAGGTESVGLPGMTVTNYAPAGDGWTCMTIEGGLSAGVQYIDATGTHRQPMDATGSAPFQLDPNVGNGVGFAGMIYEPGTNVLFVASCAASSTIPLTSDGAQLSGPRGDYRLKDRPEFTVA